MPNPFQHEIPPQTVARLERSGQLHVLLARDAPSGLVIFRGIDGTCTLLWDRKTDTFTMGQWLKGHIYGHRSDISPDGRHFVYCATKNRPIEGLGLSWTAYSRAPYLRAIGLWGHSDCRYGGGLFVTNRSFWMNGYGDVREIQSSNEVELVWSIFHKRAFKPDVVEVYFNRLSRDGWTMKEPLSVEPEYRVDVFEKPLPHGYVLRKLVGTLPEAYHPVSRLDTQYDSHEMVHLATGNVTAHANWEWADWDRKRLIWAQDGCLYASRVFKKGWSHPVLLHDFKPLRFESIAAPY